MADFTITVDAQTYDVEHTGDVLRVTPSGSDELAETVSLAHLPEDARAAVENGDYDDPSVRRAAEAVAQTMAERGA
jgi:hypothetical protein